MYVQGRKVKRKSAWLSSTRAVLLDGEEIKTRQSRDGGAEGKQRQREWAGPGDSYLAVKPVICGLTTGLPPATFPQGLSPTATWRSHGTTPPFVSLFDLWRPGPFKLTVCLQPGKPLPPPSISKCVCVTCTGRWPSVTQTHGNLSQETTACWQGEGVSF